MTPGDFAFWLSWACVGINALCILYNIRIALRGRAMDRQIAANHAWLVSEIERVAMLDHLLMTICCTAAGNDTGPIWQAWAQTMARSN